MTKFKKTETQPLPTELIVSRDSFNSKLTDIINQGKALLNVEITSQADFDKNKKEYYIWNDYTSEYLKQSFNNEYNEYKASYDTCADWVGFAGIRSRPQSTQEILSNHQTTIEKKIENLEKLAAKTELLKSTIETIVSLGMTPIELSENIFIVHGHNERIKIDVARTIEHLGLKPIILSEQPNKGQTIIEKFELHSNVGFAVVILTEDDLGKIKTGDRENYRARQNVILEMGYFIGKLGRSNVFPLYESGVELPSDLHGILYVPIDDIGGWKMKLARELKACGYSIDANKLI
jgi:predicted nucleotide-binding protein